MKAGLTILDYEGSPVQFETINGELYANATLIAQNFNKDINQWRRLPSVKRYVDALCKNHMTDLFIVRQGGVSQGTWIHERLILKVAQWISVDFEIWCDTKISELLRTGRVELSTNSDQKLLAQHTIIEVQKTNSKLVNAKNYIQGGAEQTAEYNRKNCLLFTGHTPSEWVERAKKLGLKSKDRSSGKAVLRVLKPEVACAMSFSDSLVHEKGVSQDKAIQISKTYTIGLFGELIKIGYTPEQLGA